MCQMFFHQFGMVLLFVDIGQLQMGLAIRGINIQCLLCQFPEMETERHVTHDMRETTTTTTTTIDGKKTITYNALVRLYISSGSL
mmetsp:Transcript_16820/g.38736  ORF Transcript_16820/g.38736 Transcript_16820/m.38736 type:complete len:85 (+) Transcript_16820:238-492(+)